MLKIIRTVVICLLGLGYTHTAIADESLSVPTVPPHNISIAQIETTFAVDPNAPEVSPEYVKAKAIEYFADMPEMIAIAECESGFMQYREDGTLNVNRDVKENGKRKSSAAGTFQILYLLHYDSWAGQPETNITTLEGNFAQARAMRLASGTSDWNESIGCWGPKIHKYEQRVADATS
jgi:hypothetical protein